MTSIVLDKPRKIRLSIWNFIPFIAVALAIIYHIFILSSYPNSDHPKSTATSQHFGTLAMLYGIAGFLCLGVLIADIVHLLRLPKMSIGQKGVWVAFLTVFTPLSFMVFWFLLLRNEPEGLPLKPSIE